MLIEETEEEDMGRMEVIWAIFFILPQAILALVSIHSAINFNSTFLLKSSLQYLLLMLDPILSVYVFGDRKVGPIKGRHKPCPCIKKLHDRESEI